MSSIRGPCSPRPTSTGTGTRTARPVDAAPPGESERPKAKPVGQPAGKAGNEPSGTTVVDGGVGVEPDAAFFHGGATSKDAITSAAASEGDDAESVPGRPCAVSPQTGVGSLLALAVGRPTIAADSTRSSQPSRQ